MVEETGRRRVSGNGVIVQFHDATTDRLNGLLRQVVERLELEGTWQVNAYGPVDGSYVGYALGKRCEDHCCGPVTVTCTAEQMEAYIRAAEGDPGLLVPKAVRHGEDDGERDPRP